MKDLLMSVEYAFKRGKSPRFIVLGISTLTLRGITSVVLAWSWVNNTSGIGGL